MAHPAPTILLAARMLMLERCCIAGAAEKGEAAALARRLLAMLPAFRPNAVGACRYRV